MKILIYLIRYKSMLFVALCSLALFGIIYKPFAEQMNKCSYGASVARIAQLCKQNPKTEIIGNMCPILCEHFQLAQCLGRKINRHVSVVKCKYCQKNSEASRIVMKGGHELPNHISHMFTSLTNTADKFALVRNLVLSMDRQKFGGVISEDTDIVRYILGEDIHELITRKRSDTLINNVLFLTLTHGLEEDFLALKILGPKAFLPKFYGICGSSYFVEYTPSLVNENYVFDLLPDMRNMKIHLPSWEERVKIALQFLDFILKVENSYKYPMHICDVKGDNFGINAQGELTILDIEWVRFNNVTEQKECDFDEQCNFISTCDGHCNQSTHTCSPYMVSNNLQVICKLIFLTKWKHLGLLRQPPYAIRTELSELLHECINPRENVPKLPAENRSDNKTLSALKSLFQKSLRLV